MKMLYLLKSKYIQRLPIFTDSDTVLLFQFRIDFGINTKIN